MTAYCALVLATGGHRTTTHCQQFFMNTLGNDSIGLWVFTQPARGCCLLVFPTVTRIISLFLCNTTSSQNAFYSIGLRNAGFKC